MPSTDWPTFQDLVRAYRSCRIRKTANRSQIAFESRLGNNLLDLQRRIHSLAYQPSPARVFVVTHPKPREIFAADFRDRVVHHLIVDQLEPTWERHFIHASFACRKDRGVHGAIHYLQKRVRSLSRGGEKSIWALQLDIESFFVTIDRRILCEILSTTPSPSGPMLSWLIQTIYAHDARIGAKKVGRKDSYEKIPPGKSWFDQPKKLGLPIGNLTSQFGANVYLNGLDHFITRTLKPSAYLRYMDDLTLLEDDPEKLKRFTEPINAWLQQHRKQRLNPAKTKLSRLENGISYLGYRLKQTPTPSQPLQVFAEPKKNWDFIHAVDELEKFRESTRLRPHTVAHLVPKRRLVTLLASINSRLGSLLHTRSHTFRRATLERLFSKAKWLRRSFLIKKGYRALRLKRKRTR